MKRRRKLNKIKTRKKEGEKETEREETSSKEDVIHVYQYISRTIIPIDNFISFSILIWNKVVLFLFCINVNS